MITTIIIFILVLSVLVIAHELGHFWAAGRFGVKSEEFGWGFPPRAFGFYRDSKGKWRRIWGNKSVESLTGEAAPAGTVYSINYLPLGGFVKIKGQDGEDREDKDSFGSKKIWKRALILSAGVIMNVILAFVLFSACFMIGAPQSVTEGGRITVTELVKDGAAEKAGIKPGDVIVSADGQTFADISQLQEYINSKSGQDLSLNLARANESISIIVKPELKGERAVIGVGLDQIDNVSYPFFKAIWEGLKHTILLLLAIIVAFFNLIADLFRGAGAGDAVGGPIRIAQLTGEVARYGLVNLLNFTAILSLNLAVINFLPFPALDGGRIIFLIIEKIKGKPVNRETEAIIHNIGFFILIGLIILVTYQDIARLF